MGIQADHRAWLLAMAERHATKYLRVRSKDVATCKRSLDKYEMLRSWLDAHADEARATERELDGGTITTVLHANPVARQLQDVGTAGTQTTTIQGVAAVVYDPSDRGTQYDMGGLVERIMPNAFDDVIRRQAAASEDIHVVWSHDWSSVLGSCHAGTASVTATPRGLAFTCELPTSAALQAESIRRGDVRGASFGFVCSEDDVDFTSEDGGRTLIANLLSFRRIIEVSPVMLGAYPSAYVEVAGNSTVSRSIPHSRTIQEERFARMDRHDAAKARVRQWEAEQAALWDSLRARRFE